MLLPPFLSDLKTHLFLSIAINLLKLTLNKSLENGNNQQAASRDTCEKNNPIVIVPGLMGSQLYGDMTLTEEMSTHCSKNMTHHQIWINPSHAFNLNCFTHIFSLRYNEQKNIMEDRDGVRIGAHNFGKLHTVSALDSSWLGSFFSKYFQQIITFIINLGWVYDVDIRAAPYDFRKMPLQETKQEYFQKLKELVEELYDLNKCKVVIISHSMGSALTRMFLSEQGQKWINKYVRAWISLNGAFVGAKTSVVSRAYGLSNWDITKYIKSYLQTLFSSFPSMYFLQPSRAYFGDDLFIASTPTKTFTLQNMTEFQRVIIGDNQLRMEQMSIPDIYPATTFYVRFLCVYSTGHSTITGIQLHENYTMVEDGLILEDGDGTLSTDELKSCDQVSASMIRRRKRTVHLPGVDHIGILSSGRTLEIIEKFLKNLKSNSAK